MSCSVSNSKLLDLDGELGDICGIARGTVCLLARGKKMMSSFRFFRAVEYMMVLSSIENTGSKNFLASMTLPEKDRNPCVLSSAYVDSWIPVFFFPIHIRKKKPE